MALGFLAVISGLPLEGQESARIVVDASLIKGPVNPLVFGNNIEAAAVPYQGKTFYKPTGDGVWDPAKQEPVPEILAESKRLGVRLWRYPGGCLAHGFDWKKTIGPAAQRPNFAFGLDEFLVFCRAAGAEPLMTVSDYAATPQDAADLVEYLNAPAEPQYPWAMKRAANGHKEPWKVRYFEMGNETDHGTHDNNPKRIWTAGEYVKWFNEARAKMKAIDPSIQMGALTGTNTGPFDSWNRLVASGVKDTADFMVIHTYAVHLSTDKNAEDPADLVMEAAVSSPEDMAEDLPEYRKVLKEASGKDFPLAITEYNASMIQPDGDPQPFRMTWGTAVFCGDYIRVLLDPSMGILMANHWHMLNAYWGFLRGPDDVSKVDAGARVWEKLPTYEIFRLWSEHRGAYLTGVSVEGPVKEFAGYGRAKAKVKPKEGVAPIVPVVSLKSETAFEHAQWTSAGGASGRLDLSGYTGEQYLEFGKIPVTGGLTYRVRFKARFHGEKGGISLGLGVMDARGWEATRSAIGVPGLEAATDWMDFAGEMPVRGDADALVFVWRLRNEGGVPVNGHVEVKDLTVEPVTEGQGPYPLVTACSMLSEDKKTLKVIIFNKDGENAIPVEIAVNGREAGQARIWTVSAPRWDVLKVGEGGVGEVASGVQVRAESGIFKHALPPRSMSALEISLK